MNATEGEEEGNYNNEDHYKTLEIDTQATQKQVKQAYRRLCKIHHPDKNGDKDASQFKCLSQAYTILSDTNRRRQYDVTLFKKRFKVPVKGIYTGANTTIKPIHSVRVPFTKILKLLSLKQTYLRQEIPISFKRIMDCEACHGFGSTGFKPCETCKGEKWVCQGLGAGELFVNCLTCGGKGMVLSSLVTTSPPLKKRKTSEKQQSPTTEDFKCTSCQGQGATTEDVSITCPFPKNFFDGYCEVFKGQGDRRINATRAGDVVVQFYVEPDDGHFHFEGHGNTRLRYFQYLSLSEALVGEAGQLTTIDGRTITIAREKTRGSINHGEEFWIQDEGLWARDGSWLRVVFQIKHASFSAAQIQTIQTWEKSVENNWSAFCGPS